MLIGTGMKQPCQVGNMQSGSPGLLVPEVGQAGQQPRAGQVQGVHRIQQAALVRDDVQAAAAGHMRLWGRPETAVSGPSGVMFCIRPSALHSAGPVACRPTALPLATSCAQSPPLC